jgi:hypothetical protein
MDEISYQKLLATRICDLDLDIEQSLAVPFQELKKELKDHHLLLWPDFYFGNEWGCVNKKTSISIPFYIGTTELKALQGDSTTDEQMVKILRHETGHAVNYAFRLWKREGWKEAFGDFDKKYRDVYLPKVNPWSRSYVKHLHYLGDPHYAQKHPDEDFAETFAICTDPKSRWVVKYRNWPQALQKLNYVDHLLEELADTPPSFAVTKREGEYTRIEETVSEWWGVNGEILDEELQEYLRDMSELFVRPEQTRKRTLPAWKLVQKYARPLTEHASLWISGSNKHTVRKCLRQWEAICRNESLGYLPEDEEGKLMELTILLTYHVMDGVHNISN